MKQNRNSKPRVEQTDKANEQGVDKRRRFLKSGVVSGASLATTSLLATVPVGDAFADDDRDDYRPGLAGRGRAIQAVRLKTKAALQHLRETRALPAQRVNNDEERYSDERYYASKTGRPPSSAGEARLV